MLSIISLSQWASAPKVIKICYPCCMGEVLFIHVLPKRFSVIPCPPSLLKSFFHCPHAKLEFQHASLPPPSCLKAMGLTVCWGLPTNTKHNQSSPKFSPLHYSPSGALQCYQMARWKDHVNNASNVWIATLSGRIQPCSYDLTSKSTAHHPSVSTVALSHKIPSEISLCHTSTMCTEGFTHSKTLDCICWCEIACLFLVDTSLVNTCPYFPLNCKCIFFPTLSVFNLSCLYSLL